jgi:hypothetical protein
VTQPPDLAFDVLDVSYLWPVPKTAQDVNMLISADEKLADSTGSLFPKDAFDTLLRTAQDVKVKNSAGGTNQIDFTPFKDQFAKPSTWKIAAIRIDPSAPGTAPMVTAAFGSVPQIRLIVQPVTVDDAGAVRVHDVTVHLVYNYVTGFNPPAAEGMPPIAIPDKVAFAEIVGDLKVLKTSLKDAGVMTTGKLGIHPGFKNNAAGFAGRLKEFIKKRLGEDRLAAMAFMGLDPPEPWIFFAMIRKDRTFVRAPHPSLGGESAQMLVFRGGTHVMPLPTTRNVDKGRGVSTAGLFMGQAKDKLGDPVFADLPKLRNKDIPDLIAHPRQAHFFNTDCVSCHSESSRRKVLSIGASENGFRYSLPAGLSGVDEGALPQSQWNVRNFGWFPGGSGDRPVATVTLRTGNEAAESAAFINEEYLTKKKD